MATDDPDALRSKLAAAAVSGTLAEQVASFARRYSITPAVLWRLVAEHADRALRASPLPIKATTAMRLASDPLTDVWASLPNPMAGMRD
ncbi:IucA/IucC family C-terminal-domain containing protein [Phytohabitans rumicis]|uniref:IucA/IucC family C-terminal-domain containing protein n=1 Tax=Phytohabitans rumicis TaxID=1076125 RepID=UPI00248417E3|nr:IucA/IucC family C-terminal-domain containing protein [Phytohabitans rumicis]